MLSAKLGWLSQGYKVRLNDLEPNESAKEDVNKSYIENNSLILFGETHNSGKHSTRCDKINKNDLFENRQTEIINSKLSETQSEGLTYEWDTEQGSSSVNNTESTTNKRPASAPVERKDLEFQNKSKIRQCKDLTSSKSSKNRPISASSYTQSVSFSQLTRSRPSSAARPLGHPRFAWDDNENNWTPLGIRLVNNSDEKRNNINLNIHQRTRHKLLKRTSRSREKCLANSKEKDKDLNQRHSKNIKDLSQWLSDPRIGLNIGYKEDPTLLYFDRHSQCQSHSVVSHPLYNLITQSTFGIARPWSACNTDVDVDRCGASRRGVDRHRPNTAPHQRRNEPEFCSFVHGLSFQTSRNLVSPVDVRSFDNLQEDNTNKQSENKEDFEKTASINTYSDDWRSFNSLDDNRSTTAAKSTQSDDQEDRKSIKMAPENGETKDDPNELDPLSLIAKLNGRKSSDLLLSEYTDLDYDDAREPIQIPTTENFSFLQDTKSVKETTKENTNKKRDTAALVERLAQGSVKLKANQDRNPALSFMKSKSKKCHRKGKSIGREKKKKGKKQEVDAEGFVISQVETTLDTEKDIATSKVQNKEPEVAATETSVKQKTKSKKLKPKHRHSNGQKKMMGETTVERMRNPYLPPAAVEEEENNTVKDINDLIDGEDSTEKKPQKVSFLSDRMVLSLRSSRFELPMDMKVLEKITPQDYLRRYCVVSSRRQTLYQKIFLKYREKTGNIILGQKTMGKALKEVLVNTITHEQVRELSETLEIEEDSPIDLKLFSGIAALAERILYPDFVTEDTEDRTEYHREKVECADFGSLAWKLDGVNVTDHVRKLLKTIE